MNEITPKASSSWVPLTYSTIYTSAKAQKFGSQTLQGFLIGMVGSKGASPLLAFAAATLTAYFNVYVNSSEADIYFKISYEYQYLGYTTDSSGNIISHYNIRRTIRSYSDGNYSKQLQVNVATYKTTSLDDLTY